MGQLLVRQEVEEDVGHLHPVLEPDAVLLQIGYQGEDQRFILVVFGEFQGRQVGQPADVVEEALQIQLHLQGGVPLLEGEHGLPVEPEVGPVKGLVQHVVDGLVVEVLVRGEKETHQLQGRLVAELEPVPRVGALPLAEGGTVVGEVGIVLVQPVELVQHAGLLHLQGGNGAIQVPQALVVVLHLPAAPDDEAQLLHPQAVAGAAREGGLLQDVDVIAGHLAVPDQKGGGGQTGQAGARQPCGFLLCAPGLAGAGKGFVISIGIVHDRTS